MPAHVTVITDSTSCLPDRLAAQWGVKVVQLQLHIDGHVDDEHRFARADLIQAIRDFRAVTTTPPDIGAFFWAYQEAAASGASAIVSIHLSGRMSQTADAAREAATQVSIPVYVLDSATLGMSMGYAAISAARAAAAGADIHRVLDTAQNRCRTATELLYVDTLEYLRRSGRIGSAQAMLGTALSIKPLLIVKNGEVSPHSKVRGTKRAMAKMVEVATKAAGNLTVDLAITRFGAEDELVEVAKQIGKRIPNVRDSHLVDASAIIGAHVGPGALSITVSPVS
ncbi:MAG: DegV family protein [Amycolatopsis sp.]|jgi:DegV family protein with EDD domain|uniref:DegV family protein n=1 Tax=Amycolatopsis sp. TaxID=37632 RepID=UPI00261BEC64|nr:DegV family protein [Amycolatopsis sp.]MCU1686209.1 DegV family protein [Amycolatopsis sp.]